MKICQTCGNEFAGVIKHNGIERNLGNRKNCTKCLPYRSHLDTQNTKDKTTFCICNDCENEYDYYTGSGHTLQLCITCVNRRSRKNRKEACIEYLGGKCIKCGYDKCSSAMEFHHRNPEEKLFGISTDKKRKWSVVMTELDKCDLLCCRCHRELHYDLIKDIPKKEKKNHYVTESKSKEKRTQIKRDQDKKMEENEFRNICLHCKAELKGNNIKFCSSECFGKSSRLVERPSKEILEEELKTQSLLALGRKYEVSDNAIRKWCRSYGLDPRKNNK